MTPGQTHYYICPLKGGDGILHFIEQEECVEGQWFYIDYREGSTGHGRLMATTKADLALSLLYVTLFHPVLDCVFSDNSSTKR